MPIGVRRHAQRQVNVGELCLRCPASSTFFLVQILERGEHDFRLEMYMYLKE